MISLSQEKLQLRATNEQLMSRLRQIWSKYKFQLVGNGNGNGIGCGNGSGANELSTEEAMMATGDERIFSPLVHTLETLQVNVNCEFVFD